MAEPHLGQLKPFSTIGSQEWNNIQDALHRPLSGYIGGNPRGGFWVEKLSDQWRGAFRVKYAVPCNSATSGLLAACMAVGIRPGDEVWTTPYSMSATAACAKVLGAKLRFIDIEPYRFGIDPLLLGGEKPFLLPKAIIVTNLFGHPAMLWAIRTWCDQNSVYMIEDNAQSPFALIEGVQAGTIGDIGVFSLNVHKHIQCGEGGVIVTNSEPLAIRLQGAINHGELDHRFPWLGLNLRMTETTAAIACAQLAKARKIIAGRREIGLELCDMVRDIPWIKPHVDQPGCVHVYYLWTAQIDTSERRGEFVIRMNERGVPIRAKYAPLLHQLFRTNDRCPTVEAVDQRIIIFEVCAYDISKEQRKELREIIKRIAGAMNEDRAA